LGAALQQGGYLLCLHVLPEATGVTPGGAFFPLRVGGRRHDPRITRRSNGSYKLRPVSLAAQPALGLVQRIVLINSFATDHGTAGTTFLVGPGVKVGRQLSEAGEVVHKDDDVGETLLRAAGQDSSSKPPLTFQERISLERQHKDQGPSRP
jgi:hypothetical protein